MEKVCGVTLSKDSLSSRGLIEYRAWPSCTVSTSSSWSFSRPCSVRQERNQTPKACERRTARQLFADVGQVDLLGVAQDGVRLRKHLAKPSAPHLCTNPRRGSFHVPGHSLPHRLGRGWNGHGQTLTLCGADLARVTTLPVGNATPTSPSAGKPSSSWRRSAGRRSAP